MSGVTLVGTMQVIFVTIFPELIERFCAESLLGKAQSAGLLKISALNPRAFSSPPHHKVDDIPYGGGAGMVMLAEPLLGAIRSARSLAPSAEVILLTPGGAKFSQATARALVNKDLILVCGRYEGVDQRVVDAEITAEISIGDFVLMGGEAAALCVLEATARLLPGVLGNSQSPLEESFDQSGLLEAPCYTRPAVLPEGAVPEVLLSGNHKLIAAWRDQQRLSRTESLRSDLMKGKSNG